MANLGINFDATKVEPQGVGASQLPVSPKEGWPVVISASEMVENSAKTGGFLQLTLQVIDGEHKGEEGTYRLNLFNANEKAVEIAYKQMSAICHVTGVMNVTDSAQLHNRPFRAVVGLQKDAEAQAKGYTEVKGVLDIAGNQPGKTGATPSAPVAAPAPPTPPPAAAPPAWQAPAEVAATPAATATAAPPWGGGAAAAPASTPPWAQKP